MVGIEAGKTWSRIGPQDAPTSSAASGVWGNLNEVAEYIGTETWPMPKEGMLWTTWYNAAYYSTYFRAGLTVNSAGTKLVLGGSCWYAGTNKSGPAWWEIDLGTNAFSSTYPQWYDSTNSLNMDGINGMAPAEDSSGNWMMAFNGTHTPYYVMTYFSFFNSSLVSQWNTGIDWEPGWSDSSGSDGYCAFDSNDRRFFWYTQEDEGASPKRAACVLVCLPNTYAGGSGSPTWVRTLSPNGSTGAPYYNQFNADGGIIIDGSDNVFVQFYKYGDSGYPGPNPGFVKYNSSGTKTAAMRYRVLNADSGTATNAGLIQFGGAGDQDGTHLYWAGTQAWNSPAGMVMSRTKMSNLEMGDTGSGTGWWRELIFTGGAGSAAQHGFGDTKCGTRLSDDNSLVYSASSSPCGNSDGKSRTIIVCRQASDGVVQWIYKVEHQTGGAADSCSPVGIEVRGDFIYVCGYHFMGSGRYQGFALKLKADGSTTGSNDFTVRNSDNTGTIACTQVITKETSGYTDSNIQVGNTPASGYRVLEVPLDTSYTTFGTTMIGELEAPGSGTVDAITATGQTPGTNSFEI
jgi:hypothetical protein